MFTERQLRRREFVNINIDDLLQKLNPNEMRPLPFDLGMLEDIRETIEYWLVTRHRVCRPNDFYPRDPDVDN